MAQPTSAGSLQTNERFLGKLYNTLHSDQGTFEDFKAYIGKMSPEEFNAKVPGKVREVYDTVSNQVSYDDFMQGFQKTYGDNAFNLIQSGFADMHQRAEALNETRDPRATREELEQALIEGATEEQVKQFQKTREYRQHLIDKGVADYKENREQLKQMPLLKTAVRTQMPIPAPSMPEPIPSHTTVKVEPLPAHKPQTIDPGEDLLANVKPEDLIAPETTDAGGWVAFKNALAKSMSLGADDPRKKQVLPGVSQEELYPDTEKEHPWFTTLGALAGDAPYIALSYAVTAPAGTIKAAGTVGNFLAREFIAGTAFGAIKGVDPLKSGAEFAVMGGLFHGAGKVIKRIGVPTLDRLGFELSKGLSKFKPVRLTEKRINKLKGDIYVLVNAKTGKTIHTPEQLRINMQHGAKESEAAESLGASGAESLKKLLNQEFILVRFNKGLDSQLKLATSGPGRAKLAKDMLANGNAYKVRLTEKPLGLSPKNVRKALAKLKGRVIQNPETGHKLLIQKVRQDGTLNVVDITNPEGNAILGTTTIDNLHNWRIVDDAHLSILKDKPLHPDITPGNEVVVGKQDPATVGELLDRPMWKEYDSRMIDDIKAKREQGIDFDDEGLMTGYTEPPAVAPGEIADEMFDLMDDSFFRSQYRKLTGQKLPPSKDALAEFKQNVRNDLEDFVRYVEDDVIPFNHKQNLTLKSDVLKKIRPLRPMFKGLEKDFGADSHIFSPVTETMEPIEQRMLEFGTKVKGATKEELDALVNSFGLDEITTDAIDKQRNTVLSQIFSPAEMADLKLNPFGGSRKQLIVEYQRWKELENLVPVMTEVNEYLYRMGDSESVKALKGLTDSYVQTVLGVKTHTHELIDRGIMSVPGLREVIKPILGDKPVQNLTETLIHLYYYSFLGIKTASGLRNLSQILLATSEAKAGMRELATMFRGFRKVKSNLDASGYGNRDFLDMEGTRKVRSAIEAIQLGSDKVGNLMMKLFEFSDVVNRISSYNIGYSRFSKIADRMVNTAAVMRELRVNRETADRIYNLMKDNKLHEAADLYGKEVVARTQFLYGKMYSPMATRDVFGKAVLQFKTFGLNWAEWAFGNSALNRSTRVAPKLAKESNPARMTNFVLGTILTGLGIAGIKDGEEIYQLLKEGEYGKAAEKAAVSGADVPISTVAPFGLSMYQDRDDQFKVALDVGTGPVPRKIGELFQAAGQAAFGPEIKPEQQKKLIADMVPGQSGFFKEALPLYMAIYRITSSEGNANKRQMQIEKVLRDYFPDRYFRTSRETGRNQTKLELRLNKARKLLLPPKR